MCLLPNLHSPINFYFLSSSLSSFYSLCLLTPLIWAFPVWSPSRFLVLLLLMCVFDVGCVCGVRWQQAAATHSSPLWRRSQGRRAPTARSPLPLPAAPPPQGLTLKHLLTRYCNPPPPWLPPETSSTTWPAQPPYHHRPNDILPSSDFTFSSQMIS